MPLDQKLKSDMTGVQSDTPQNVGSDNPWNEPVSLPGSEQPPEPMESPAPRNDEPEQMRLLREIESQLQLLNKNVLALENAVNTPQNPDFQAVFARIDAARAGIEKMLPLTPQPAEKPEDGKLLTMLQALLEKQERNDRQLVQSLRDNSTFQLQVRQGMQQDLDELKKQLSGEQFQPMLKEIASVYAEYQTLLEDETISARSRRNLLSLFEQLEDLLTDYGAEILRSEAGSVRQGRTCKIIEKIPTGNQEQHNTIARSRRPGVVRDRTVLVHEFVDVYVYDPNMQTLPEAETMENSDPVVTSAPAEEMTDHTPNTEQNGGNET